MKAVQVRTDAHDHLTVQNAYLPFHDVQMDVDVEVLRNLAKSDGSSDDFAELNQLSRKFQSDGVWTQWTTAGNEPIAAEALSSQLVVVASGSLRFSGSSAADFGPLHPGDVAVIILEQGQTIGMDRIGDCRTIHLAVSDDLFTSLNAPVRDHGDRTRATSKPTFKRIVTGPDQRSYFKDFDVLFSDNSGVPSPVYRTDGFWFAYFPDACFVDLHPEVVKNLVVPLSGSLQLGTAGGVEEMHEFYPGDVCLAEDSVGEGHTDKTDASAGLLIVEMRADGLW